MAYKAWRRQQQSEVVRLLLTAGAEKDAEHEHLRTWTLNCDT